MTSVLKIFLIAVVIMISGCGGSDSCGSKLAFGGLTSVNCGGGDLTSQVNGNEAVAELMQKIKNGVAAINSIMVINNAAN